MKLKKLFAGILAVAMMATMAAPAFAASGKTTPVNNNGGEFSITKTLTNASDTNVKDSTVLPDDAVASLTVVNNGNPVSNPTGVVPSDVAITQVTSANLNTAASKFTITMPNYTIPGVYTYYLTEADTGIAGIVPNTNGYRLTVYAIWDKGATDTASQITLKVKMDEGTLTESAAGEYTFTESDNKKIDTINNNYQAGTVTVTKKVDGTFARKDSVFDFNITLTSERKVNSTITYNTATGTATITPSDWTKTDNEWTVTKSFQLTADHTETLTNIPYGVNYTVSEMNGTTALNANDNVTIDGVEYTVSYDAKKTGEVGSVNEDETVNYLLAAEIKNVSGSTDVDTGVILDNAPYIALMMIVVAGAAVMVIKKRRHYED